MFKIAQFIWRSLLRSFTL